MKSTPEAPAQQPAQRRPRRRLLSGPQVIGVAAFLVLMHTAVRGWVLVRGDFYWDDLILIGRGGEFMPWSTELLWYSHDGHFMPGAFVIASLTTRLAPLQWWLPALEILVSTLLAAVALVRLLVVIAGPRPVILAPLTLALVTPIALPAGVWWAASLNQLPFLFAWCWLAAEAILLDRNPGRMRHVGGGLVVLVTALLFYEKSVVLLPAAFVTAVLTAHVLDGTPLAEAALRLLRAGRVLWRTGLLVLVVWLGLYVAVPKDVPATFEFGQAAGLTWHGWVLGIGPALTGGPLSWERWLPGPPWAAPSALLASLAAVSIITVVIAQVWSRRRTAPLWAAFAAYIVVITIAMVSARSGPNTAHELAQTLRYFTELGIVAAITLLLGLLAPRRVFEGGTPPTLLRPVVLRVAGGIATFVVIILSLISTASFARSWESSPTGEYIRNGISTLQANRDTPLLDQALPLYVLLPVAYPNNLTSRLFARIGDGAATTPYTPELWLLDDEGRRREAAVDTTPGRSRTLAAGAEPGCGTRIPTGSVPTTLHFDGPLLDWEWTLQLNYFAGADTAVRLRLNRSDATVHVPLQAGLHTLFIRLHGPGTGLVLTRVGETADICIGSGPIGSVVPLAAG